MDSVALLRGFETCTLPLEAFGHRQHIEVAWALLRECPHFEDAALRFCAGLRRFAAAHGKGGLYNETITWAYLALVNERTHTHGEALFEEFAERNADLFAPGMGALSRYYAPGVLQSDRARRAFLLPGSR